MEKVRIHAITAEQIDSFDAVDGNLIVPDNFEVYVMPSAEDLRRKRIAELEAELGQMGEPSTEELIEAGKMMHPYYMYLDELQRLKEV